MTEEQLKDVNKALNFLGIENVQNIIIISKDATNGDMIKAMFPNAKIGLLKLFYEDWWNAPYKAESED